MVDIHKVIGKIPCKLKKGFVLPKHRYTGPFNPLNLQLDSKIIHYRETSHIMLLTLLLYAMAFAIEIIQLVNMNAELNTLVPKGRREKVGWQLVRSIIGLKHRLGMGVH